MILSECGIPYDFFEASDKVGGRMYTKRFSDLPDVSQKPDNSNTYHDYYDIGAMRYPDIPFMRK
jgi:monoamine oxidase